MIEQTSLHLYYSTYQIQGSSTDISRSQIFGLYSDGEHHMGSGRVFIHIGRRLHADGTGRKPSNSDNVTNMYIDITDYCASSSASTTEYERVRTYR